MMSQIEIWNMQDYCEKRNEERNAGSRRTFSIISLLLIIAGTVLAAMSGCLIVYVLRMTVEMTGAYFLVVGIGGLLAGTGMAVLGMIKREVF